MKSDLREALERKSGEEELQWILPHPFLPPRFKKICNNRNMILVFDDYFTIHVRWEGARRHEHLSLSPGQARQLFREVQRNIVKYTREAGIFSRFLTRFADPPEEHPRFADKRELKPANPQPEKREEHRSRRMPIALNINIDKVLQLGGENPMGGSQGGI